MTGKVAPISAYDTSLDGALWRDNSMMVFGALIMLLGWIVMLTSGVPVGPGRAVANFQLMNISLGLLITGGSVFVAGAVRSTKLVAQQPEPVSAPKNDVSGPIDTQGVEKLHGVRFKRHVSGEVTAVLDGTERRFPTFTEFEAEVAYRRLKKKALAGWLNP
jgi:hypothetical protein